MELTDNKEGKMREIKEVIETIEEKVVAVKELGYKSICLCGSSTFCDIIAVVKWIFEKHGILATGLHYLPEWYVIAKGLKETHHIAEQENVDKDLDDIHLKKIDMSDAIFVVNFNTYIGERTAYEIDYATKNNKPILYLEPIK